MESATARRKKKLLSGTDTVDNRSLTIVKMLRKEWPMELKRHLLPKDNTHKKRNPSPNQTQHFVL